MLLFSLCTSSTGLRILLIIKILLQTICTIIPLIIIYRAFSTLFKGSVDGGIDMKKDLPTLLKNLAAGLIIFLIPTIINFTFTSLIDTKSDFISCINNASLEGVLAAEAREEQEAANKKKQEAEEAQRINKEMQEKRKKEIEEAAKKRAEQGGRTNLNYSRAKEVPSNALKNASHSDPSIVITSETGEVLAQRKAHVLREGASTTKVFTGYAGVKLLDIDKDTVSGSNYITSFVGQYSSHTLAPGQTISVKQAATRGFPGSSNTASEAIAIAIGYKKGATSEKEAHIKGLSEINNFVKSVGCNESNLGSGSGLSKSPMGGKWFKPDGYPKDGGTYGHTANDLATITIAAMKDKDFLSSFTSNNTSAASLATDRNKNGLFFIKSGTGYLCHGIWGFNNNGKRYYIALLGIDCKNTSDDKYKVANDLYNWSTTELIK